MQIGAQLYTVRDFCKTKKKFAETLERVADIGYKTVQVSGTCKYEPEWLNEQLKKCDLKCVITHIPADDLIKHPAKVARDHYAFDCNYVGLGWYGFDGSDKDMDKFLSKYLPVAKAIKEEGRYFMYHNHEKEFRRYKDGIVLEYLAEQFSPDIMGFTFDTYWAQTAGADPAYWIEKLSGRVPCIHLKDHSFDRKMAVIGEGNINFDRVFAAAEKAGTEFMLVEQDDCNKENPFDCLRRSYEFLKSRGFE